MAKRNCVVVVAEGAGEAVLDGNCANSGEKDASGNTKLAVRQIKYDNSNLEFDLRILEHSFKKK